MTGAGNLESVANRPADDQSSPSTWPDPAVPGGAAGKALRPSHGVLLFFTARCWMVMWGTWKG